MGTAPMRKSASLLMDHMSWEEMMKRIPDTKPNNVEHTSKMGSVIMEIDVISFIEKKILLSKTNNRNGKL